VSNASAIKVKQKREEGKEKGEKVGAWETKAGREMGGSDWGGGPFQCRNRNDLGGGQYERRLREEALHRLAPSNRISTSVNKKKKVWGGGKYERLKEHLTTATRRRESSTCRLDAEQGSWSYKSQKYWGGMQ